MFLDQEFGELTEVGSGRHWSVSEIRAQVKLRQHSLAAAGLTRGDKVLIHFGNQLEFFAELIAVWSLGACAIPTDSRLTRFEIENIAKSAGAKFCIVNDLTLQSTSTLSRDISVLNTIRVNQRTGKNLPVQSTLYLDDDALILFTSGSTGDPKGVVHTHRSLREKWTALGNKLGIEAYRKTLCVLPTHFGHGLICNCLFPWLSGCHLHIAPSFDTGLLMQLGTVIDEHEITFMSSVPSMWSLALKGSQQPRKRTIRRLHVGSAPLSSSLWIQIQEWAGIKEVLNAYGITETGSWVAGTSGDAVEPESGLIGEPWGCQIKILNLDNTNDPITEDLECGTGDSGMVWLQTPSLMKGYFERPDLTAASVRQGWFMTGDIGIIDDRGRLYLKGRKRDEINKGGMKVYPADIDEVVGQFAATRDVCTFGIEDDLYGQNVAIAVVLADESDRTIHALYQWIDSRIAQHKHPNCWYLLTEIPRTSRGKVNRDTVAKQCLTTEPLNLQQVIKNETTR